MYQDTGKTVPRYVESESNFIIDLSGWLADGPSCLSIHIGHFHHLNPVFSDFFSHQFDSKSPDISLFGLA